MSHKISSVKRALSEASNGKYTLWGSSVEYLSVATLTLKRLSTSSEEGAWPDTTIHKVDLDTQPKAIRFQGCSVVHCKKKKVIKDKVTWSPPQHVRVATHISSYKLAGPQTLKAKARHTA